MLPGLSVRYLSWGRVERMRPRWSFGAWLGLAVVLLVALLVRLPLVLAADFPLNDGGLFFVMAREVAEWHYALPVSTSYNLESIPFAYPPLAFYLAAMVATLTGAPLIDVVRALPLVTNLLTIAVYYVLARTLLPGFLASACAAVAFALLPRSYEWLIMGGGLTRSLGFLLALTCLVQAHALWERPSGGRLAWCSAFAALALLAHLEMGLFAVYSLVLFFLCYARGHRDAPTLGALLLGVAALTAPWWLTVLARHGPAPFLAASDTAGWSRVQTAMHGMVDAVLPTEPLPSLLGALALLGIAACLARQRWLLPAWLPVIFLLTPRSAATEVTVPLGMLAAIGLVDVVLATVARAARALARPLAAPWLPGAVKRGCRGAARAAALPVALAVAFPLVFLLNPALLPGPRHALGTLDVSERQAMEWIAESTSPDSAFLVLSARHSWEEDYVAEWFPVLAQRRSVLTPQGAEWLPSGVFAQRTCLYNRLREQALGGASELDTWTRQYNVAFTHVYLSRTTEGPVDLEPLRATLLASPNYSVLLDNAGATVLERIQAPAPLAEAAAGHPIARDCQSLYEQPLSTQVAFYERHGTRAPWVWAEQHARELGGRR